MSDPVQPEKVKCILPKDHLAQWHVWIRGCHLLFKLNNCVLHFIAVVYISLEISINNYKKYIVSIHWNHAKIMEFEKYLPLYVCGFVKIICITRRVSIRNNLKKKPSKTNASRTFYDRSMPSHVCAHLLH